MSLFSMTGVEFILRWLHFFFGIMWIGHLYYFNFTQGSFMAEADPSTKSGVTTKLVPRALWWFRWGAMWTMVTGILMLGMKGHMAKSFEIFLTSWGIAILIGTVLGLTMWFNVWFVIWPNQKIVIASATQVAQGGAVIPEAAASAARALVASRTNTLLSIPMLFFMGAATHLPLNVTSDSKIGLLAAILSLIWAGLELNALKGKTGPMTTVKGVIHSGFGLTIMIYLVLEICL